MAELLNLVTGTLLPAYRRAGRIEMRTLLNLVDYLSAGIRALVDLSVDPIDSGHVLSAISLLEGELAAALRDLSDGTNV